MHFAVFQLSGSDFDHALRVNAEGTGALMARFRDAESILVLSTIAVYTFPQDPGHHLVESDPLSDQPISTLQPTYAISKIAQEAVARSMARTLDLPTTIARMGVSYSSSGGLPAYQLDMMLAGESIPLTEGRTATNPIFQADINAQASKLLQVATVPATVVNWAGDEVVTTEDYLEYLGQLVGMEPTFDYGVPGTGGDGGARPRLPITITDQTKRRALVGKCAITWREGMLEMLRGRHPSRLAAGSG